MAKSRLKELERCGQAVWLDYIRRDLIRSAEFRRLIEDDGLKGVTSNPTIFEKAIGGSADYERELGEQASLGKSVEEIYESLSSSDIKAAAGVLRPLFEASGKRHGYVSYEISPHLAHDTRATVAEARRLWDAVGHPNVMIKVPAVPEGIPAIEELVAGGYNINVTLIFSMRQYEAVAHAYIRGLEQRLREGRELTGIASVASVFVSRVDTLVDKRISQMSGAKADRSLFELQGKTAVASAKLIYQRFKQIFHGGKFRSLREKGAWPQQPLWASTGAKNPKYSDILYVQELIGPGTVNTMPPATLDAFRDHGVARVTIEDGLEEAAQTLSRIEQAGISLDAVGEELQHEGERAFVKSFDDLQSVIGGRRRHLAGRAA